MDKIAGIVSDVANGSAPSSFLTARRAGVVCAVLLLLFAVQSWTAVRTKCATSDEVVHAPAGYTHLRYFDFRANPEHPPLWKYWVTIPWLAYQPDVHVGEKSFAEISEDLNEEWNWGIETMYHTPGNDADRLLFSARFMMLVLTTVLGAVISYFAYRAAGPVAAVVATGFYAFDPNLLAHASLVTNDVLTTLLGTIISYFAYRAAGPVAAVVATGFYAFDPNLLAHASLVTNDVLFSLEALGLAFLLWRLGERATVWRIVGVAVMCGVMVTTKFTGILAGPVVVVTLGIRALLPGPWEFLGRPLASRARKLALVGSICLLCAVVGYVEIWAAYGFRWRTAPDPAVHPNLGQMVAEAALNETRVRTGKETASMQELRDWYPSRYTRTVLFALNHKLLPDPFLNGMFYAYSKSLYRNTYLFGKVEGVGKWYYFPVAVAVKTPTATLLAIAAGVACAASMRRVRQGPWVWVCLLVPIVVFAGTVMRSNLNLGVRHIFPIYPAIFVGLGVVAARLFALSPRKSRVCLGAVFALLVAESVSAWPNYIPFFNALVGGARGGYYVLGDSNIDWGQDLPALAEWQKAHADRKLYLAYFGTADPVYHHVNATMIVKGIDGEFTMDRLPTSGVVAVSVSMLQGTWIAKERWPFFEPLRERKPDWVLGGGSIFLYDLGEERRPEGGG